MKGNKGEDTTFQKGKLMLPVRLKTVLDLTLGDGSITWANGTWKFKFAHTEPQRKYAETKKALLESVGYKPKCMEYVHKNGYKKDNLMIEVYFYHQELGALHNMLYGSGAKNLTPDILTQLDTQSLAYWYMDDGTVDTYYRTKSKQNYFVYDRRVARSYKFATNSLPYNTQLVIQDWLKSTFNIDSTISTIRQKEYNVIISRIASKDKFLSLVRPYIIPSMQYKIKHPHTFDGIPFTVVPRDVVLR